MRRRQFITSATVTVAATSIAGCSGNSDDGDDTGDNGGDGSDGTDSSGGDGGSGEPDSSDTSDPDGGSDDADSGSDGDSAGSDGTDTGGSTDAGGSSGDGAASPRAAVETYVEAGQQNDAEAMAAIVHPDGSATTSPDTDGGSGGEITVVSMSTNEESDTQATVTVEFEMTYSQDGEERTTTFETVYQVRTYEGNWYVYSISGGM